MKLAMYLVAFMAGPVQAQFIADGVDVASPAGAIAIVDNADGFSRELHVGGQRFFTDGFYRFVSIEDQRGALYLVSLSSGGSACAAEYVWLDTSSGAPQMSPTFGTCAVHDSVSSDAQSVTVTMQSFDAADGFVAFIYDGTSLREEVVGQRSAGIGLDPKAWIGRYPFEVFADADWRAPLIDLMGEDAYRRAGNTIETALPMELDGGWVVGKGCRSRMCDAAEGAIALHPDGRVVVVLNTAEAGVEVYGVISGMPPDAILSVLNGQ